jgi:hypothetical protein
MHNDIMVLNLIAFFSSEVFSTQVVGVEVYARERQRVRVSERVREG